MSRLIKYSVLTLGVLVVAMEQPTDQKPKALPAVDSDLQEDLASVFELAREHQGCIKI